MSKKGWERAGVRETHKSRYLAIRFAVFFSSYILPRTLEWADGFMHACLTHAWASMSKYQLTSMQLSG